MKMWSATFSAKATWSRINGNDGLCGRPIRIDIVASMPSSWWLFGRTDLQEVFAERDHQAMGPNAKPEDHAFLS